MKRSRSIELVLMGAVPLLLSACDNPSPPQPQPQPQPQTTVAYQGLTQCISDGKVTADICEKAYADAVQAQYRDGPRFDSLADCQSQYGYDQCHHVQTSSGGWFMPALAGFMVGHALSNGGYNYGYGYGGIFGQPLYRTRGDRAEWRTASGERFGGSARGPYSPSVAETLSRGGFGMSSAARASWGG